MTKDNSTTKTQQTVLTDGRAGDMHVLLSAYEAAMSSMLDGDAGGEIEARVRRVLVSREDLARLLGGEDGKGRTISADELARLANLDEKLKGQARSIVLALKRQKLDGWRDSLGAPPSAWWWSLQDRVAERRLGSTLITYLLWLLIAVSLSFILEILRRFLNADTDLPSTIIQGLLALLATGTVVRGVKQFVDNASEKNAGRPFNLSRRTLAVAAVALMALAALMEWARPHAAHIYNDQGAELYEKKQLTDAAQKYRRAISLEPAYALAHYNMGNVYEDVLDYDKAMAEYESAIMADQSFYRPYNNLARLYIIHRDQPLKALELVDKALLLKVDPKDDASEIRYRLYKNRGWANLGLKNYQQAKADLERALEVTPNGADANCLMAQVLDAQKDQAAAGQWTLCKALAEQQPESTEVDWAGRALEQTMKGRQKK